MDFLGLRNLTFVQKMQELLAEIEGIHLKIEEIDLEDKETLALFASGNTKVSFNLSNQVPFVCLSVCNQSVLKMSSRLLL